jgi:RNA polymerase sigma-70 factor (ECF subfamily)
MQFAATIETSDLIALLRQKSRQGFGILYDKYASCLFGIICKIVQDSTAAQDILQEVFVKVWKNIEQFDESKGAFYTWLINIARYTAIDYLRSSQRKQRLKNQMVTGNEYIEEKDGHVFAESRGLKAIVAKLEPKYREVIDLLYYYGHTQDEVSKILNLPLGTVKTRARAGLQILRNQLS